MADNLPNHLRAYRRRDGLTQGQLSFLLGAYDAATVSRYERYVRQPDLETALACQAIFDVPAEEIFPGVHASVEARVRKRASLLLDRLAAEPATPDAPRIKARLTAIAGGEESRFSNV
jgi:transcriptional regulator with XRE-family HTH domain